MMKIALVLSGGIALGAYQAGAYAALHRHGDLMPQHVAGASVGAINAALIVGGPEDGRIERLQRFWLRVAVEENPFVTPWVAPLYETSWRHASSWMSALQTRVFGRSGLFRPRLPELLWQHQPSLYDLAPLRATIVELVDFDRLNGGEIRLSVATTDVETGELVMFDTAKGDRIGPDHLLASCSLFPDFAPTMVEGRALADGGFIANAPIQAVLGEDEEADLLCFVVDLFSPRGVRPRTLEQASSRQWELLFGNQSRQTLKLLQREHHLRLALHRTAAKLGNGAALDEELAPYLAGAAPRSVNVLHLAYCPKAYEAGPEKAFDFSHNTLGDRWKSGVRDMEEAMDLAADAMPSEPGFYIHRIESPDPNLASTG